MGSYEAERYHDFSAGHRVVGHENKCSLLHGHNYRVYFTLGVNDLDGIGRVMDFSAIKDYLCEWLEQNWDHKTLLWARDPIIADGLTGSALGRILLKSVVVVPFNPTAENMARYLVEDVGPSVLPPDVKLIRCRVEETRKCSATYTLR